MKFGSKTSCLGLETGNLGFEMTDLVFESYIPAEGLKYTSKMHGLFLVEFEDMPQIFLDIFSHSDYGQSKTVKEFEILDTDLSIPPKNAKLQSLFPSTTCREAGPIPAG